MQYNIFPGVFCLQVGNVEAAGAAAAIVYDNQQDELVAMAAVSGYPDPGIPAIFVTHQTGMLLQKLASPSGVLVHIEPVSAR
jgi:hypothetical protein